MRSSWKLSNTSGVTDRNRKLISSNPVSRYNICGYIGIKIFPSGLTGEREGGSKINFEWLTIITAIMNGLFLAFNGVYCCFWNP